jgi:hypothetical protein
MIVLVPLMSRSKFETFAFHFFWMEKPTKKATDWSWGLFMDSPFFRLLSFWSVTAGFFLQLRICYLLIWIQVISPSFK